MNKEKDTLKEIEKEVLKELNYRLDIKGAIRLTAKKKDAEWIKKIDDVGVEDIIDFLNNLKNLRIDKQESLNYEEGELPFGTCDYMNIDDMINKLEELKGEKRE